MLVAIDMARRWGLDFSRDLYLCSFSPLFRKWAVRRKRWFYYDDLWPTSDKYPILGYHTTPKEWDFLDRVAKEKNAARALNQAYPLLQSHALAYPSSLGLSLGLMGSTTPFQIALAAAQQRGLSTPTHITHRVVSQFNAYLAQQQARGTLPPLLAPIPSAPTREPGTPPFLGWRAWWITGLDDGLSRRDTGGPFLKSYNQDFYWLEPAAHAANPNQVGTEGGIHSFRDIATAYSQFFPNLINPYLVLGQVENFGIVWEYDHGYRARSAVIRLLAVHDAWDEHFRRSLADRYQCDVVTFKELPQWTLVT